MGMESKFLWMDGELVPFEKATIHFLTPALHYGAAVFEGIRAYDTERGPAIFRLRDHAERLIESAEVFGFRNLNFTVQDVMEGCKAVVRANGFRNCYIRPLIYLTDGGWNLNVDGGRAALGIAAWEWNNYLGEEALAKGIRANISSFTRHHVNVMMTKAKVAGNYANSFLAKTDRCGWGSRKRLCSTLRLRGRMHGGEHFHRQARQDFHPRNCSRPGGHHPPHHLHHRTGFGLPRQRAPHQPRPGSYTADEVFVVGTAAECIGLGEIDFRKIGTGVTGPITQAIQKVYHDVIRGRHPRSAEWW